MTRRSWLGVAAGAALVVTLVAAFIAGHVTASTGHITASPDHVTTPAGATEPAGVPRVSFCGVKPPVQRPDSITITCGDGNELAEAIRWTSWTSAVATGLGTLTENDCSPDCADGDMIRYAAEIVLDTPHDTSRGPQFSRIIVIFDGPSPGRRPVEVATLPLYTGR